MLGILLGTLIACTELVRRLDIQFWQPWTCRPALNLHVFQREPGPFDVVFLGPSTMQRGLLPEILQPELDRAMGRSTRFFSVGQPGPKYRTYRTIVRDVLVGDHEPELLILAVGGELFHETDQTDDYFRYYASLHDLLHHRDYGSIWKLSEKYDRNRFRRLGTAALSGALRGIPTLWQWLGGLTIGGEFIERCEGIRQSRGFPLLGWDIRLPERQWREGMKVRLEHLRKIQSTVPLRGAEAHALEDTLRILKRRGTPTLLVRGTPAKITQKILRMPACKRVTRYYHILSKKFGFPFLDLAKPQITPPLRMYNDPYHLNRDGAAKMTPYWARKVIAPRLKWIEKRRGRGGEALEKEG